MQEIDLKDKKILYELDCNARQPLSTIAKQIGLTKESIIYRIKRLQKKGIIRSFYTLIDGYKLGYQQIRIYLTYQYLTPQIKKEIINYFVSYDSCQCVFSTEGNHDLTLVMGVQNIFDFHNFWEQTLTTYRDYFKQQTIVLYLKEHIYSPLYLNDKQEGRKKTELYGDIQTHTIDTLDRQLLNSIAEKPRQTASEIARKLNSNYKVITYRMKKLQEQHIICGYKADIDFTKLGYRMYKVDIELKDYKQLPQIITYVEKNPHLVSRDITLGYVDVELDFILQGVDHLHHIMEDLSLKFTNTIRHYSYFTVVKNHKKRYIPKLKIIV